MIQTKQHNFYSAYCLVNLCRLVIDDEHNGHFIMQCIAEKTDKWRRHLIPVILSGIS